MRKKQEPERTRVTIPDPMWSVMVLASLVLGGCGAMEDGRGWGEDAIWPVDMDRVVNSAKDAILDSGTWAPAAGALVFAIGDWDRRVSVWASEHTPVFGSQEGARDAGDTMLLILNAEVMVTALATPGPDEPGQWAIAKTKGLAVEAVALGATALTTLQLKDGVGRLRPDGADRRSFPSGHASFAFALQSLSNSSLDAMDLPAGLCGAGRIGNLGLACAVAWARVEGKAHYPSDVLAGAALGHFLTAFIYNAFMNLPEDRHMDLALSPRHGGAAVQVAWRF